VCEPCESDEYAFGEEQLLHEPESIRHSKLAFASPLKPNDAEALLVSPLGPESIEGAEGAAVSTVQFLEEALEVFPA
jgi:hypothetical protein